METPEKPLLLLAVLAVLASLIVGLFRSGAGRLLLAGALAALGAALTLRGIAIAYLPLTQRAESVAGFVFFTGLVALFTDRWAPARPDASWRLYRALLLLPLIALLYWSTAVWPERRYPFALLVTIWYLLHVPLSFLCYGLWSAAFAASVVRLLRARDATERAVWDERIGNLILWGFLLFNVSMIFGAIWGYLAWGYVFLWDPKMLWSVSLWFAYAALIHLGFGPARPRLRAALAIPAWLVLWMAFLGVGFFRTSIHGFG